MSADPEPNPVRGLWYAATSDPEPLAPCYGCRRGWRRAYTMADDTLFYHHLVREGVTLDCVGTMWLIDQLLASDLFACTEETEVSLVEDDCGLTSEQLEQARRNVEGVEYYCVCEFYTGGCSVGCSAFPERMIKNPRFSEDCS